MDKKKMALIGITAIGSVLVSYFVYRKVADDADMSDEKIKKRERMIRKARLKAKAARSQNNRIVGASHQLLEEGELTKEEEE